MAKNINEFLNAWKSAKGNDDKRRQIADNIWYDWFCSSSSLYNRTKKFIKPLKIMVQKNPKIGELEVSGKNCCPINGPTYDVLRIFNSGENGKFRGCISFDSCHDDQRFVVMDMKHKDHGFDTIDEAAEYLASIIK